MKWETVNLGEITTIISGNAWSSKGFMDKGKIPIIRIQNIGGNKDEKLIYWNGDFDKKFVIRDGDMLLSLSGSIKVNYWNGPDALLNQRIIKIVCKSSVSKSWLFWYLNEKINHIISIGKHALVNNVSINDIKALQVPLPPLHIQEQIANTLDKADAFRRKDQELLAKYDVLEQAIFYDMFGDPVKNEKGWEKIKLGDIALVKIGPFGSLLHAADYVDGGIPLINPMHISNKRIFPERNYSITPDKMSTLLNYRIKKGDIIMGRRGEMGRCALVTEKEDGWLCGTGSLFIRPKTNSAPTYLLDLLTSKQMKDELVSNSKGTTMSNLNQTIIEKLQIISPPLKLQIQYQKCIDDISLQKSILERTAESSFSLFQTLIGISFQN